MRTGLVEFAKTAKPIAPGSIEADFPSPPPFFNAGLASRVASCRGMAASAEPIDW